MPAAKNNPQAVEKPGLPRWVEAMLRIEESLAHGTVALVQQFANCRPLALAVTSPGVAYHFESCDPHPGTAAFMVLLRYDPNSRTIAAQCSIELNHRTVHDADDSIRLAVDDPDEADLATFLRAKTELFKELYLQPRDLGPEEVPEDDAPSAEVGGARAAAERRRARTRKNRGNARRKPGRKRR
ncbi:MAG: hypothetical protein RDV41_10155 [Planctomycetota bacterium]|nr:hypothetical protein [Planctomycetota bacterium]